MPNLIDHEPNLPLIQRLEGAVLAARQAGATDQLVETLLALAKGYFDEGATPKGLTQLEEALQLVEGSNRELESRLLGYKGMALARLGNVQFAQRALFRSLRLAEETGHKALQSDALAQIGQLLADRGEWEKAVSRLEQGLALAMEMGDQRRMMNLAGKAGTLFLAMGALDKAADYYAQALHLAQQLSQPRATSCWPIRKPMRRWNSTNRRWPWPIRWTMAMPR
jgi:tetratricopeptide (TPR) repeat protein